MNKYLDEKAKKLLMSFGAVVGIIILIIVIVLIVGSLKTKKLDYGEIEDKMVSAAKEYYSDRTDALPLNNDDMVEISAVTLSEEKYMKDLSKYVKYKNASCSGKVIVTKSGDYYNYSPYLNCGDIYTTKYLYEEIIPTIVSKDDGLYKINEYSPVKQSIDTFYVYKGDYVNNFVKIDETVWRIIKLDSDFNFTLIQASYDKKTEYVGSWDNRYNNEKQFDVGVNDYYKSLIRRSLNTSFYETLGDTIKSKILIKPVCVSPIAETQKTINGSIECKKTIDTDYVSLLTTYDFLNASLDSTCKSLSNRSCINYNYLVDYSRSFWLLNPNAKNTYTGYKIISNLNTANLSSNGSARPVINVSKYLIYKDGNGTEYNPYVIK